MTIRKTIQDREHDKFLETSAGETAVRTLIDPDSNLTASGEFDLNAIGSWLVDEITINDSTWTQLILPSRPSGKLLIGIVLFNDTDQQIKIRPDSGFAGYKGSTVEPGK